MRIKKITEVIGLKVYTDSGDYFGEIEEANISENKVETKDDEKSNVGLYVGLAIGGVALVGLLVYVIAKKK
jgi:hypothetical protein